MMPVSLVIPLPSTTAMIARLERATEQSRFPWMAALELRLRHLNPVSMGPTPQGVKSNGGSDLMQLALGRLVGALRNWSVIERAQALTGLKLAS